MESSLESLSQRKKRPYKKSRFGCRNCKLRRVKCDEIKPHCTRCTEYGVTCNFKVGIPDLQTSSTTNFQCHNIVSENKLASKATPLPATVSSHIICSDGITSFVMDVHCMARLEHFRLATLSSFGPEMTKIWQQRIPHLAFKNPCLMHTMISLAISHERQQYAPIDSKQSEKEAYHHLQSVLHFNKKLSRPIEEHDKDPIWATAALVGMMTLGSFDADDPEEVWPLRPSSPTDLEWFRIGDRKKIIWNLTDPLRYGGVFSTMADEYAEMRIEIPLEAAAGLPPLLAEVCDITSSSDKDNNPYFVAAHVLFQLRRMSDTNPDFPGIRMVGFMSHSVPQFRTLLWNKDPVALLLLALWYETAGKVLWWVERRARVETESIRRYLERLHGGGNKILQLLPSSVVTLQV